MMIIKFTGILIGLSDVEIWSDIKIAKPEYDLHGSRI